jgi:hypothetical protein
MGLMCRAALAITTLLSLPPPLRAVVLVRSAQRNVTPPTGTLTNSGWQWQGRWRNFLGTAISRRFFITAEHVGGNVGEPFILNGVSYNTIASYDDPNTDLQVWKVDKDFPSWAGLYKKDREGERGVVIYGRGTARGGEVVVNGQLKGWLWGDDDHVQSWGTNILVGASGGKADPEAGGGNVPKQRIYWKFDRTGGLNDEATVTAGDSGAGVFIKDLGVWRLAGVNFSVESEFSYPDQSNLLNGALIDVGGLKSGDDIITDTVKDNASRGFATRIGGRWEWIFQVVQGQVVPSAGSALGAGVPEPGSLVPAAAIAMFQALRRRSGPLSHRERVRVRAGAREAVARQS